MPPLCIPLLEKSLLCCLNSLLCTIFDWYNLRVQLSISNQAWLQSECLTKKKKSSLAVRKETSFYQMSDIWFSLGSLTAKEGQSYPPYLHIPHFVYDARQRVWLLLLSRLRAECGLGLLLMSLGCAQFSHKLWGVLLEPGLLEKLAFSEWHFFLSHIQSKWEMWNLCISAISFSSVLSTASEIYQG